MFCVVTGQEEDQYSPDAALLAYSLPLIEKLSHCADTIEQHLIFKVLSMLKEVDDRRAKCRLEIIHVEQKIQNLKMVKSGVHMVAGVVEMTGIVKGLVSAGQWGEALTVLEEIHNLWDENPTSHPPTSSQVKPTTTREQCAPPSVPDHLQTLTLETASLLTTELVKVLRLTFNVC